MSAREATEAFLRHWGEQDFAFAIINYANADMVGHTGVIQAAVAAVETVDECLGRIVEAVHGKGGACIVTADHGNADEMLEEDGSPDTAHSLNPVPFIVTAGAGGLAGEGILADVAPTALALLGIEQPRADDGPLAARVAFAACDASASAPALELHRLGDLLAAGQPQHDPDPLRAARPDRLAAAPREPHSPRPRSSRAAP